MKRSTLSKLSKDYNLLIVNPLLAKEWHPKKNVKLTPSDLAPFSNKKVWWQCANGHEWHASVANRSKGRGCPYCKGKRANKQNCLDTVNPALSREWHPTKNVTLSPEDVTPGSKKIVWWQCIKGHEWRASVDNRNKGTGCPYCSGKLASKETCLLNLNPILAEQWHPTKNGNLTPRSVTLGSGKKVWWQCAKGHEWQAIISSRNKGAGCPFCAGQAVCRDNCLKRVNPRLAREWHPTKNRNLTPNDVTANSAKRVWWLCKNGHEWQSTVANRNYGSHGCPYCTGKAVGKDNCLLTVNPSLAKEWHSKKNGKLRPSQVTANSGKIVWWQCAKGHVWKASINNRSKGSGCPYCAGQAVCEDNNLAKVNFALAQEWHPIKNGKLKPNHIMPNSRRKVWWKCVKGHEWQATPNNRSNGRGCPYCSNKKVCEDNCLETFNPVLVREWHPKKNGKLTPRDVTANSSRKVWWLCKRGHEWSAQIASRNRGNGCPYCNSSTSLLELRVYTELMYIFKQVEHRKRIYGFECDIYLPSHHIGIEVDGLHWHKDKYDHDNKKTDALNRHNITLIRMRERGLKKICKYDISFSQKESDITSLRKLVKVISMILTEPQEIKARLREYSEMGKLVNNNEYTKLLHLLPSPLPECSLEACNENLAAEWHPEKNAYLKPSDVTPNSGLVVWWKCAKGHEWKASICNRNKGTGCPFCIGKRVSNDNCLETVNPILAREWHPIRNGELTPKKVTAGAHNKVWWLCGKGHEWEASVANRNNGRGCPYCSGKKVSDDNCLKSVNPSLAKEWHPTKNSKLLPTDVTANSQKIVWWQCVKGHEWRTPIARRNQGSGCPYCSGQKVCIDNCLETINPEVAKEWHPNKNGSLTAKNITANSNKIVWWKCKKGHEWKAPVYRRNKGSKCICCLGRRASAEHCLKKLKPVLAGEWHPTKNGKLTPSDVTPNSHKLVWWKCSKGHEWLSTIASRNRGSGCPKCKSKK